MRPETDPARLRRTIHAACRELGLDEDGRRAVQEAATGKASLSGMTTAEMARVLDHLRAHGWGGGNRPAGRPAARHAYQRKVYALWGELKRRGIWREADVRSLWRFCARVLGHGPAAARATGVIGLMQPEGLDAKECGLVTEALKDIGDRAGLEDGWDRA